MCIVMGYVCPPACLPACMHAFVMHSVVCMFVLGVAGVVAVVIAVVEDVGNSRVHDYLAEQEGTCSFQQEKAVGPNSTDWVVEG